MNPKFDKKYKTIVDIGWGGDADYLEKITWLHENIRDGVDLQYGLKYGNRRVYVGFESPDDALVFKIKYSR